MPTDTTCTDAPVVADTGDMPNHFPDVQAREMLRATIEAMGRESAAKAAGLHEGTLRLWLTGHRSLALDARLRLAEACGYTVGVTVTLTNLEPSTGKQKGSGPLNTK